MISKNNWYKIAIKQKELYEFYSLGALSDEVFSNHPELLHFFIDKLNSVREYYLVYLLDQIGGELYYVKPTYAGAKVPNSEENIDFYNKLNNIILKLEDCSKNLNSCNLITKDFEKIMYYFNELEWESAFGGELWGNISNWTKKLYNFKPIINAKYNESLMQKVRALFMIIDTINSLHHNTGSVLNDLPDDEFRWLLYGLENIKHAESPIELAYLSGNKKLSNIYKREEFPFFERSKTVSDKMSIRYEISEMTINERKELSQNAHDPLVLDLLMDSLGNDTFIARTFSINPYIAAHSNLVKKLIGKMEDMDYNDLLIRENLLSIAKSDFINDNTINFILDYLSKFPYTFNEPIEYALIKNINVNIDEDVISKKLGSYIFNKG